MHASPSQQPRSERSPRQGAHHDRFPISSREGKIAAARSPSIPAGMIAGAPSSEWHGARKREDPVRRETDYLVAPMRERI
jgi:hypothetical protein